MMKKTLMMAMVAMTSATTFADEGMWTLYTLLLLPYAALVAKKLLTKHPRHS